MVAAFASAHPLACGVTVQPGKYSLQMTGLPPPPPPPQFVDSQTMSELVTPTSDCPSGALLQALTEAATTARANTECGRRSDMTRDHTIAFRSCTSPSWVTILHR